ncbi:glycoside hydrolase family 65 protein [Streptomyces sp. NBC_01340]|uniref:glycoside hydrolase family 65 protein n=1 Tax=unclassified Streptomyces TaxID=2593676 RepID=UPI002251CC71|nr:MULTISPECIES: glycosyl hydrolase family 65 protein [unclassified Streptomyces]MCX4458878.1 glycoside hydrolase family 65 protein [Streptomyces sp. NBC_01719]MCX4498235.1 glycoside hydrolase family 65 protein [Streptomyces sp. NBC_01728]WSI42756.1 glycoside hydrolase family 65 protein [Streptomyces sp. NBC_01340]
MSEWTWEWTGYDPAAERLRESLCTLGNGYFATRGAVPECRAGLVHCPGTYAAGCYNRLESAVAGRQVVNEDLVNLPNWLLLRFRLRRTEGAWGPWFSPDRHALLDHRHTLDLRRATLTRAFRHRGDEACVLGVEQTRLVHMGDPHLAALRTVFTADDWSGEVEIESCLDGEVINGNVHRYRALNRRHVTQLRTGTEEPHTVWLSCRTSTSDIAVAMAARTTVVADLAPVSSELRPGRHRAVHRLVVPIAPRQPVTVEKTVALHTSRDTAISDPLGEAVDRLSTAEDFPGLLDSHVAAWERLWQRADIQVPGEAGRILRFHLFHVLQTLSPHTADLDVGVPARGLHGEAYRGHVFWDELFVLPYLNLHFPEVSLGLLNYRYRRLPRACRAAAAIGRAGAMYPWQSGSDGREETQEWHLNPHSGHWLPDHSRLQHHVGSAIAYNVWQYCEATGDTEYLHTKGAEMLVQIARFWTDLAVFDPGLGRYRIRGVVGPDEYHDSYPGAALPGLDDNAYTNVTAAWVLTRTLDLLRRLPAWRREELFERVRMDGNELTKWDEISRRLRVPFHQGVISQFEGYGDLAELDWDAYRTRYGSIRRLDRILEAEGDTVNRYKASKQADVLMLDYLFSPTELRQLFLRLGYDLDDEVWRRTVDYYLQRTSHGSTLSGLVHGLVLARARRAEAWQYVQEALEADIADIQGGTTGEGIHLGAMAGTLDLVQRGLTGLETREDALWLDPVPLPALSEYGFSLRYRGHWGVGVRRRGGQLEIGVPDSEENPIRVVLADRAVTIAPGETCTLVLAES